MSQGSQLPEQTQVNEVLVLMIREGGSSKVSQVNSHIHHHGSHAGY
jgi:hypothetical protein